MTHRLWPGAAALAILIATVPGHSAPGHQTPTLSQSVGVPRPNAPAPPPGGAPVSTGAITGVVTDAATGTPVPGAEVVLRRVDRGSFAAVVARQLADGRGRFAFTDLVASPRYLLSALASGYLEDTESSDLEAPRVVLADGQWVADARVFVQRAGAVGGVVTDEMGEPVVGAYVRLLSSISIGGARRLVAGPIARTDDRGVYRIGSLGPGRYLVMAPSVQTSVSANAPAGTRSAPNVGGRGAPGAVAPPPDARIDLDPRARLAGGLFVTPPPARGTALRAYPIVFHPASPSLDEATAVDLAPGEDRGGVDIRIAPVPAVRVSGRAMGPPEVLTNVRLRLIPLGLEALGGGSEAATAGVDADGTFVFLNVPAGRYALIAPADVVEYQSYSALQSMQLPTPPGGRSWMSTSVPAGPRGLSINVAMSGSQSAPRYTGRMVVDVGGADQSDIELTLAPSGTVSGRIVIDPDASPESTGLPRFTLHLEPAQGDPALGYPRQIPGEDASSTGFSISPVYRGQYYLRGPGPTGWAIKSVTLAGRDHTHTALDTTADADVGGLVVTLTNRGAELTGRVPSAPGRPNQPAVVVVFPVEEAQWTAVGLRPPRIRATAVANDGTFSFDTLPAGDYYVVAVGGADTRVWQRESFFSRARGEAARVSLEWGGRHTATPRIIDVR